MCLFAAPYNLILLFNIISFFNQLSAVKLISQFPFIEREIGFNGYVLMIMLFYFPTRLLSFVSINLRYLYKSSPDYIT